MIKANKVNIREWTIRGTNKCGEKWIIFGVHKHTIEYMEEYRIDEAGGAYVMTNGMAHQFIKSEKARLTNCSFEIIKWEGKKYNA